MATKSTRDSDRESERPYTPNPPQHMDPSKPPVKEQVKKVSKKVDKKQPSTYTDVERERQAKPKQLGESDTEISDETTI